MLACGSEGGGHTATAKHDRLPGTGPQALANTPLIDAVPPELRVKVIGGTNNVDLTPYINAALQKGGVFDLGGYGYLISSRLLPAPGTHIMGRGSFLAAKSFDDTKYRDKLNMMIRIVDGLDIGAGVVFDGNHIMTPGLWLTGARNTGPVSNVVLNGTYKNLSFDGIDVSRANGLWQNRNIKTQASISDVGWTGANLEGITGLNHDGLRVESTGWSGIYVGYSSNVRGDRFSVSKATPPYRVYDGPGGFAGVEKGFLFSHFATQHARWSHFRLYDNRHAGYDGFGIGEDGALGAEESADIYAQGEIWYAGMFGFDVSSDMTADVKIYYPSKQGVQFGLDLGGVLTNVSVKADVRGNRDAEAARFSATGTAIRSISMQAESPVVRLESGGAFQVVPGQTASGTGLAPGTQVVKVDGNIVTLTHEATETHTPARPMQASFRGTIKFNHCALQLTVQGASYGVGIESAADGYTSYNRVTVTGDLSSATKASVRRLNGPLPTGVSVDAKLRRVTPHE